MTCRDPFYPMRPGLSLPRLDRFEGKLPTGWHWQPKIDDERGIILRGEADLPEIYNRHWFPLASHKQTKFMPAAERLLAMYPEHKTFDVALLGFRGHWTPGPIVLLDLPSSETWSERWMLICHGTVARPVAPAPWFVLKGEKPPDLLLHLAEDSYDPRHLFALTKDVEGVEGIIGRDPNLPYICGESDSMIKSRWK